MCGHGQLAISLKESVEMIYGNADYLQPIAFLNLEGKEDLEHKMMSLLDKHDNNLIVVDLFGGTPFNAAASLALRTTNIEVITGMSLPLCLELISNIETLEMPDLIEHLLDTGKQCVQKFNKTIISETEDDFI